MTETYEGNGCLSGLSEWSIDAAIRLESTSGAHILRRLVKGSRLERNAVLCALSEFRRACFFEVENPSTAQKFDALTYGQNVGSISPKALVEFVFGVPPNGFIGLLARLRGAPLPPTIYCTLFQMFEKGDQRARALRQLEGQISPPMVLFALELDAVAVHPSTLSTIYRSSSVSAVNEVIGLIRRVCSTATDENISMSLSALHKTQNLSDWANRWFLRMDRLPCLPPFGVDPEFKVLSTGPEMAEVGRQFRNCLITEIKAVAAGRVAYAVSARHSVIVEFARTSQGWIATNAWGHGNAKPDETMWRAVGCLLSRHSIPALLSADEDEADVLRFLSIYGRRDGIAPHSFTEPAAVAA